MKVGSVVRAILAVVGLFACCRAPLFGAAEDAGPIRFIACFDLHEGDDGVSDVSWLGWRRVRQGLTEGFPCEVAGEEGEYAHGRGAGIRGRRSEVGILQPV